MSSIVQRAILTFYNLFTVTIFDCYYGNIVPFKAHAREHDQVTRRLVYRLSCNNGRYPQLCHNWKNGGASMGSMKTLARSVERKRSLQRFKHGATR